MAEIFSQDPQIYFFVINNMRLRHCGAVVREIRGTVAAPPSKYDLKINNNRAEGSGSTVLVRTARYALQSDLECSTYSDCAVEEMDTFELAEERKRRQKVGYFPSACLAPRIRHDIREGE